MGTEKIGKFTAETDYGNIPNEAVGVAKKAVLDYFGVAIAGSNEPVARILSEQVKQIGAVGEAGVICGKFKTSADLAAWANGTISHAIDYDDIFASLVNYNMHPSVPILPAVFALGEKYQVSGKDILTAYIVGIEIEFRIGCAIGQKNSKVGWHPSAVIGTMGATAASAKILKLNAIETQMALGIASSLAGGIMRNVGTMTKPMQAGNAARNGIVAAQLAKRGFTADSSIMEGESGFCSLFSGGSISDLKNADLDLGDIWDIVSKGLAFKPYPSCRGTHASIDAILHLRKEGNFSIDQVATVICKASPAHAQFLRFPTPKSGYEGKFSMPYCVATALLKGKVSLDDFTNEKVTDAEIQDLLPRVSLVHPKDWGTGLDQVEEVVVKLNNGKEYSHKVLLPKGDPQNPMTDKELVAKFRDCTKLMLNTDNVEKALDLILHIEELKDVTELTGVVTNLGV